MPKRHKEFENYSRSHQNKLIRLLRNNSNIDDHDEYSTRSSSEEEEIHTDPSSGGTQSFRSSFNRSHPEEDLLVFDNDVNDGDSSEDSSVFIHLSQEELTESATDNSDNDRTSESDRESTFENDDLDHHDDINDDDEPLYEGARLTVFESMISILNLQVRHKLSNALLSDILDLIELHCPSENKCKTSVYRFQKYFDSMRMPTVRHYHCVRCNSRLETSESACSNCADETKIGYFIEVSLSSQVRACFKRHGFYRALQYRFIRDHETPENLHDIYDGSVYKELFENNGILSVPVNFSMTWYTDGIRIFKSSKFSIWPVYMIINELPYAERMKKENILLVALWFGEEKPVPNLFLQPLCRSCKELSRGIEVDIEDLGYSRQTKGIVICGTCDLPAKALFLNMKQYNGQFGCQKCKQEGTYLREARVRVYPFEKFELRSDDETLLHAREALNTGKAVCGVKGPTILSKFVHENMRAISIDSMHCVFEGVVKSLLTFWFSSNYSEHPSSLILHIDLVDERLTSFTPLSSVQRLPRSIKKHLAYWKANELKAWFFYYSVPCVNDIMEEVYFNHYKLLLLGVTLLSRSSISINDLNVASRALREFVSMFEYLYFKRNMTNNLHQLLHLVENVRQFGPLWTTSCFPLEDLNGKLKKLVHGSKSAQLQIHFGVSKYLTLNALKNARLREERPASKYCDRIDYKSGRLKRHVVKESTYIVGKYKQVSPLPEDIRDVLERSGINGATFYLYNKLLKQKMLFTSTEIQRNKRTNSTYALYTEFNTTRIGKIQCFIRVTNCLCVTLCPCEAENYAILRPCLVENEFSSCIDNTSLSMVNTLYGLEINSVAVDITKLEKVCFYLKIHDASRSYVIEPANSVEFE